MHTEILKKLIEKLGRHFYLEIGLDRGLNWSQIKCDQKTGVEPLFLVPTVEFGDSVRYRNETIYRATSDMFFKNYNDYKFDLIFIDGLHTFEQSKRDFINSLAVLRENGLIILHDTMPANEDEAMIYETYSTTRRDYVGPWVGDVWKTVMWMNENGYECFTLDVEYGFTVYKKHQQLVGGNADYGKIDYKYFVENKPQILNLKPITYLGEFISENSIHKSAMV